MKTITFLDPVHLIFCERFATQIAGHTWDRDRIQNVWKVAINPNMNLSLSWYEKSQCPDLYYHTHFSTNLIPKNNNQGLHLDLHARLPLWRKGLLELTRSGGVFEHNFGLLVKLTAFLNSSFP